jgi:hypothetical protein
MLDMPSLDFILTQEILEVAFYLEGAVDRRRMEGQN